MTRRDSLKNLAAGAFVASAAAQSAAAQSAAAQPSKPAIDDAIVQRHDAMVEALLHKQDTSEDPRRRGSYPDDTRLYSAGSAGQILESFSAAYVYPKSKFFHDRTLPDRMRLAAGFLERAQSPEGFISLLSTNFNSPPDTGFVVHLVGSGAAIARMHQEPDLVRIPETFLKRAGAGLTIGGIHTPNHRWVISSALSQINELFPDPRYIRRIEQWLAEGIDIDADGQYTERSMLTYNVVSDRAFFVLASKLKRPQLLDPVRRNLQALLYLLHSDGELVTEISRRQDVNVRGDAGRYWYLLRHLAQTDHNPQFAALAARVTPANATLPLLLEYPQLLEPLPAAAPLPDNFEKPFPEIGIVRFRRGPTSATIINAPNNRFFSLHHGDTVINAVRFASAFFGKGQFVTEHHAKEGSQYVLTQSLEAPYYQPVDHPVRSSEIGAVREERKRTQICRLTQRATISETPLGFRVRIQSSGTDGVPLAVEINVREGGTFEGCTKSPVEPESWVLTSPQGVYKNGRNQIRFGPGLAEHMYTQVRGAEPRLPGPSIYLTGFTPFDHTLEFECL